MIGAEARSKERCLRKKNFFWSKQRTELNNFLVSKNIEKHRKRKTSSILVFRFIYCFIAKENSRVSRGGGEHLVRLFSVKFFFLVIFSSHALCTKKIHFHDRGVARKANSRGEEKLLNSFTHHCSMSPSFSNESFSISSRNMHDFITSRVKFSESKHGREYKTTKKK